MIGYLVLPAMAFAVVWVLSKQPDDAAVAAPSPVVIALAVTHLVALFVGVRIGRRRQALVHGLVVAAGHPTDVSVTRAVGRAVRKAM